MTQALLHAPLAPGSAPAHRAGRSVRPGTVLTVLAGGAAVCVGWPIALALAAPRPIGAVPLIAHLCGMAAGYGVIVLVALMSRTPVLERSVGADRLARWHGRGGRLVVGAVVVHAWAATAAWAGVGREGMSRAAWQVLRMPWLISATMGTLLLLVVAGLSARAARRRVRFETWHGIHLLVYVAVALGFVHQLGGPDLTGHRLLQVLWALLYTQTFALVLKHRVVTPLRNAGRHRLRVTAVVPEGAGVVSIVVEGRHLEELRAESGQFFRWRFLTPDSWSTAHPFSLSAPPTPTHLRLTVKSLGDGSGFLQRLEPGTWVMAEGPYGAMTARRRTRRDVLLVAGGVGITPMRALFETVPLARGRTCCCSTASGPERRSCSDASSTSSAVAAARGCSTSTVPPWARSPRSCSATSCPTCSNATSTCVAHRRWPTPSAAACAAPDCPTNSCTRNGSTSDPEPRTPRRVGQRRPSRRFACWATDSTDSVASAPWSSSRPSAVMASYAPPVAGSNMGVSASLSPRNQRQAMATPSK